MNIADIGYRREHAPQEHRWRRLGELHYQFDSRWCNLKMRGFAPGAPLLANALPDLPEDAPYISGDIMSCSRNKQGHDPMWLGMIYTEESPDGSKVSYKIVLEVTPVTWMLKAEKDYVVLPVFLNGENK